MFKHIVLAALVSLGAPLAIAEQVPAQSQLMVAHSWARALPANAVNGAVYLHIHNLTQADDALLAASSPVAKSVELHTIEKAGDVMKMASVPSIEVKAGEHVELAPGGLHLMLFGLNKPFNEGDSFPVELTFAKAGKVSVNVQILAQAPSAATEHEHMHHH